MSDTRWQKKHSDAEWLRRKVEDRRSGPYPGTTVNLTPGHAQRLLEKLEAQEEYIRGMHQELNEAEDILAEAAGYPHDEDHGWVVGDHTTITLAMEVRDRVKDLEFMRGIAQDVLANVRHHRVPPWFMVRAFADALAFKHDKQSKQRREADEGTGLTGVEGPEGLGASVHRIGEQEGDREHPER